MTDDRETKVRERYRADSNIVEWIEVGEGPKSAYRFALAPATLVFEDVIGVSLSVACGPPP